MVVTFNIVKTHTKKCANSIHTYIVDFIPVDIVDWLKQFGSVKILSTENKFITFKHTAGFQLSSVIGGSIIKIYGTSTDENLFQSFENKIIEFFRNYSNSEE